MKYLAIVALMLMGPVGLFAVPQNSTGAASTEGTGQRRQRTTG